MKMIMEKTKWKKLRKVWLINMKITLREWQNEFIPGLELETNHEQEIARLLSEKEIVKIIELKDGLSISTNSFVGSVYIGNIQLNIMQIGRASCREREKITDRDISVKK